MALKKIAVLGEEPIGLELAKAYLRVEHDNEDGLIESFISTARASVEAYTSRALIKQKWQLTLNAGYAVARSDEAYLTGRKSRGEQGIELPRSPFVELCSDPVLHTEYGEKSLKDFRVDTAARAAHIHFGPSAQSLLHGTGSIQIEFIAGYDDGKLPEPLKQGVLLVLAQLYENRIAVNDNPGMTGEFHQGILTLIKPYQVNRLA
ncbi:MAG: head-tail connector protein [Alphaproteobacteria bacterium]|nr:head-tail connector protein [Alphaproteobacteria bacterium]